MRYILVFFIALPIALFGQGFFKLQRDKPVSISFEVVNNTLLIPVCINGISFTFLLDTGVKEIILFAQAEELYLKKNRIFSKPFYLNMRWTSRTMELYGIKSL